ncbi:MAG: type 1 glutamine amidotransferase domain-containing protein [Planctomycetota bacterium]|nr:type 1 glutamine amidotransferase domain-containing protein [Planctomycetota bacterium]
MVVTSHGEIEPGEATGLWLEEFAVPFAKFKEAGYAVTVASPKGGKTPIDPRSLEEGKDPAKDVLAALESTKRLGDLTLGDYVAVFFPGGHGTMFDLPEHDAVKGAVAHFIEKDQPAAFVCHGPAALVGATLSDGTSVVKGRKVTGFTDSEERAVKLDEKMPFLLETKLKELGGSFAGAENWQAHVVVDGNLITGQNPASSGGTADALLKQLQE